MPAEPMFDPGGGATTATNGPFDPFDPFGPIGGSAKLFLGDPTAVLVPDAIQRAADEAALQAVASQKSPAEAYLAAGNAAVAAGADPDRAASAAYMAAVVTAKLDKQKIQDGLRGMQTTQDLVTVALIGVGVVALAWVFGR